VSFTSGDPVIAPPGATATAGAGGYGGGGGRYPAPDGGPFSEGLANTGGGAIGGSGGSGVVIIKYKVLAS
jgi:hypothetical protein